MGVWRVSSFCLNFKCRLLDDLSTQFLSSGDTTAEQSTTQSNCMPDKLEKNAFVRTFRCQRISHSHVGVVVAWDIFLVDLMSIIVDCSTQMATLAVYGILKSTKDLFFFDVVDDFWL